MEEIQEKEKPKKELPSKTLAIIIDKNTYDIKFPSNGALIDIESMKINMSGGTHKDMLYSSENSQLTWTLIEAISTFNILIPSLKTDLAVKSLLDLDMLQSKSLVQAYNKQYVPWFDAWKAAINELYKEDEQK